MCLAPKMPDPPKPPPPVKPPELTAADEQKRAEGVTTTQDPTTGEQKLRRRGLQGLKIPTK